MAIRSTETEHLKRTMNTTAMPEVTIYTDGGCRNNRKGHGVGGAACILRFGQHEKKLSGGWTGTTNNRMEIRALLMGLQVLKKPCKVLVVTDSKYLICVMSNLRKYEANGWHKRSKSGRLITKNPVLNADLLRECLKLSQPHALTFKWVKGHKGHAENEECDRLAGEAAENATTSDAK